MSFSTVPARRRHPIPVHLEAETVTHEPDLTTYPCCGHWLERIGEEVTEEIDLIPAKLIRRRIVRPKYACRCGRRGVTALLNPIRLPDAHQQSFMPLLAETRSLSFKTSPAE